MTPLYAVLPVTHSAARNERIHVQDLANDEWILLARRVHPTVHDAIIDAAQRRGISPKHGHDVITGQQAVHLVSQCQILVLRTGLRPQVGPLFDAGSPRLSVSDVVMFRQLALSSELPTTGS